jgi:adenylate kinase
MIRTRLGAAGCLVLPRLRKTLLPFSTTATNEFGACPTPRAIAAQLFYSFGQSNSAGEVGLAPEDLRRLLLSMGIVCCDAKLGHISSLGGSSSSSSWIREEEFLGGFDWLMKQGQDERDLLSLFQMLDKDASGFIDLEELMNLHTTTHRLGYEEAKHLILAADRDGDGKLSWSDFLHFMSNNLWMGWKLLTAYRVIMVVGGPASGKGTVCEKVASKTNSVHVSSGDLLRHEVQMQTPLGLQVQQVMAEGGLVEASVVLALMEKFLAEHPGRYVLLDGFPRSLENARDFTKLFGQAECYIQFDCSDEVMEKRIIERGKSSGREDDTRETAAVRIATYHKMSNGPLKYFESTHLPGYVIDATRSIDDCVTSVMSLPMFRAREYPFNKG